MPDAPHSFLESARTALADRYGVERVAGEGGMAIVVLAEDRKHRRRVAIKVLRPELAAALGAQRFLREIETAAGLRHPHILPLYDSGEAGGHLFYVMPYVEGESLRERLDREEQLPVGEAVRIAREVADALAHAHARGIVHRDIKPENILLEEGHAVVSDFGIARAIDEAGGTSLTATGMFVGTPAYMSPEHAAGTRGTDARSDVYSLGCVLYEMLAGAPPFTAATVEALVHQHLTAEPPPVTRTRRNVPPALERTIRAALEKTPADRFATAAQFRDALDATVSGEGAAATGVRRGPGVRALAAAAAVVVALGGYLAFGGRGGAPAGPERTVPRVVVLPFENQGRAEDEYFADGITEEIAARLARLGGLGVIARTTAMQYKGSPKDIREIGQELDVDYVLEGTVRWEHLPDGTSRVRVIPQLVRGSDATQLWAEAFEEPLAGVFQVQAEIAERVARALDLALLEPERRALRTVPTADLDAYDAYLRGNEYSRRGIRREYFELAIRLYEQAVERDPGFALAHARLSWSHSRMFWFHFDRSEDRLARARAAVDRALALDPDLPDARLALGYHYYWGRLDYDRALTELALARRGMPGDADVHAAIGYVQRRQGRWLEAIASLEEAVRLDPRAADIIGPLAECYGWLRDHGSAQRHFERALSLTPDAVETRLAFAWSTLAREGDTRGARAVLEEGARIPAVAGAPMFIHGSAELDLLERDFASVLDRLEDDGIPVFENQFVYHPAALLRASAHAGLGRAQLARLHFDSARAVLEREVDERPGDPRVHGALGIAYAGLGRREDAVRAGAMGVELLPIEREAMRGAYRVEELARIHAITGDGEAAIDQLEILLSRPSHLSAAHLRLHPVWDALRGHPRFERLAGL